MALLIIGVILGALASGIVQWKVSQDENEAELRNIAQALYIDVSGVEDAFNYSLSHSASKPNYIHVLDDFHYYDNNGLYYAFVKDVSGFDSEISADIYEFYAFVIAVENMQENLLAITNKRLDEGNVTDYDFICANKIMKTLCAAMPDGIKKANNVKRELRERYPLNTTVPPTITLYSTPQTYILQGGSVELST